MKKLFALALLIFVLPSMIRAQSDVREKELLEIAEKIRQDASGSEYIKTLKPSMNDLQSIFASTTDVGDAWMYVEEMYLSISEGAVVPGKARTETRIVKGNTTHLTTGEPHDLPGGYVTQKDHFKFQLMIYGLKFVEPEETSGFTLNAFFYVNDHWVFIPKAWKAFEYE